MQASFSLPKGFMLQLTGRYDAPRLVAQGERLANYSLDAGLRKSFFNKKLSLNLNGTPSLRATVSTRITKDSGDATSA